MCSGFAQDSNQKKLSNYDSIKKGKDFNQNLKNRTSNHIHELWDELLKKHVSTNGNVDYKGIKYEYKKLLDYIYVLSLIHENEQFDSLSKNEKLAYWINLYNALTVDLIIRNYPITSIKDIKNPWKQRLWKAANLNYNLDEIEHVILRKMNEPRIHFAIVCASISCPKLQNEAFNAANLEIQLSQSTREFLMDSTKNTITEYHLELSKIFKWFSTDFNESGGVRTFIKQYSKLNISDKAKITFKTYNWNLNE